MITFKIELTWSKIMAFIFQMLAFWLDLKHDLKGQVFMYALPFNVFLITGKQAIDFLKAWKGKTNDD